MGHKSKLKGYSILLSYSPICNVVSCNCKTKTSWWWYFKIGWLHTKTSSVFTIGGMEDFFFTKKDLFDDYEDELEEGGLSKTWNKIPNMVIKCKVMKLET